MTIYIKYSKDLEAVTEGVVLKINLTKQCERKCNLNRVMNIVKPYKTITMSRVSKLKHYKEIEADDLSLPTEKQRIVRVISSKGNNLHEVEGSDDSEENFLVSMPNKFRKNVWIKRGSFVLMEEIDEGDKVKGEIVRILTTDHQKEFNKHGIWPKKFSNKRDSDEMEMSLEEDLQRNQNRRIDQDSENETSSESD